MRKKYDWPALIAAQAESGLTQAEFCRQQELDASSFSLNKRRLAGQADAGKPQAFVRAVSRQSSATAMIALSVGGVSLRFGSDADPAYVAKLVAALS